MSSMVINSIKNVGQSAFGGVMATLSVTYLNKAFVLMSLKDGIITAPSLSVFAQGSLPIASMKATHALLHRALPSSVGTKSKFARRVTLLVMPFIVGVATTMGVASGTGIALSHAFVIASVGAAMSYISKMMTNKMLKGSPKLEQPGKPVVESELPQKSQVVEPELPQKSQVVEPESPKVEVLNSKTFPEGLEKLVKNFPGIIGIKKQGKALKISFENKEEKNKFTSSLSSNISLAKVKKQSEKTLKNGNVVVRLVQTTKQSSCLGVIDYLKSRADLQAE